MGTLSGEVRTEVLCGRICDLEAENAKLRELVADAMAVLRVAEDELGRDVMVAHYPLLHIRMHELGIELVDRRSNGKGKQTQAQGEAPDRSGRPSDRHR